MKTSKWSVQRINALPDYFSVEIMADDKCVFASVVHGGEKETHEEIKKTSSKAAVLVKALNDFRAISNGSPLDYLGVHLDGAIRERDALRKIINGYNPDSTAEQQFAWAQKIARKVLRAVRATEKKFGYTTKLNAFKL